MSAAQWVALILAAFVCLACVVAMAQEFRYDQIRRAVEHEERQIDQWLLVARSAGVVPKEPTPIHDRLVCEYIEQAEGWAS